MSKVPIIGGIPLLGGQSRISNVPFLELVGHVVQLLRSRINVKSNNSFLYIACDGKSSTFGRSGHEEDLIIGIVSVLKNDETARKYVLDYFNKQNEIEDEQGADKVAAAIAQSTGKK